MRTGANNAEIYKLITAALANDTHTMGSLKVQQEAIQEDITKRWKPKAIGEAGNSCSLCTTRSWCKPCVLHTVDGTCLHGGTKSVYEQYHYAISNTPECKQKAKLMLNLLRRIDKQLTVIIKERS